MNRCACGMAVHDPDGLCESCEWGECPGCGEKTWYVTNLGTEAVRLGFCAQCEADGSKAEAIAASERWAVAP